MLRWIFLGATGWLLLQAFGLLGPLSILTFPLLGVGAVVAIVVGVRRYRPAVRWPFNALAVGFFLFLVGGIARESFGTLGVVTSARSIIPDLITIPGYVITAAGLFGIVRARQGGRDYEVDTFLDAAVAALAATAIGWIFVLNPAELQSSPLSVRVVLGVYPMVSVFLVAIAASLAFSRGTKRLPANTYMLAAMVCVLIGDVVYAFVETHALHIPSNLIDLPYGFVFLFVIIMTLNTLANFARQRRSRPGQTFSFWNRFLPGRFRAPMRSSESELRPDPGTSDFVLSKESSATNYGVSSDGKPRRPSSGDCP